MNQTIQLTDIAQNSYAEWFISTNSDVRASVQLKGLNRVFTDTEGYFHSPIIRGGDDCMETALTLSIDSDSSLDVNMTFSDILSSDGKRYGRNFIFCCKLKNDYNDLYIQISTWERRNAQMEEQAFIMNLFYQYLILKEQCHFNYIQDTDVTVLCLDYDANVGKSMTVQSWFQSQYQVSGKITNTLQKFKLILTTLMKYESKYAGAPLSYSQWADMVMAFGSKRWKEPKITMESCPFQYMRGIILSKDELSSYNECYDKLENESFFTAQITLATSHGKLPDSHLQAKATRPLNFRNYGIFVSGPDKSKQIEMITSSVQYAVKNGAEILIFPELSIDEDVLGNLKDQLTKSAGSLKLVVGGSYYKKIVPVPSPTPMVDTYQNSAPLFYKSASGWIQLAVCNKMVPFSVGYNDATAKDFNIDTRKVPPADYDLLVEDIVVSSEIALLPAKDGVIGVAICRDVMDLTDIHNPVHRYADFVDLLLVISDNTGDSNMFTGVAECLARWHNCATLYTNSVTETQKPEGKQDNKLEVSFALYPSKGGASSTSVAGEISYIANPLANSLANTIADVSKALNILFSGRISYAKLTDDELNNCCKIYTIT